MVASENDRNRAGSRQIANLSIDHRVAPFQPHRFDVGVAGVDHVENLENVYAQLERVEAAVVVVGRAYGPRPESGARLVCGAVIERRTDDDRIRRPDGNLPDVLDQRQLGERGSSHVCRQGEVRSLYELLLVPSVHVGVISHCPPSGGYRLPWLRSIVRPRPAQPSGLP